MTNESPDKYIDVTLRVSANTAEFISEIAVQANVTEIEAATVLAVLGLRRLLATTVELSMAPEVPDDEGQPDEA